MGSTIVASRTEDVLTITLNRPEALNAADVEMAREMWELAGDLRRERAARVIVVKGAGTAFMAGGDVRAFASRLDDRVGPFVREVIDGFHAFVEALRHASQPVLASIHGSAAGGGLSLALACDMAIVSRDARLAFAYSRLGTSPDGGCTYFLPRIVGDRKAKELLLLGRTISADEAAALGLVNWVVGPAELEAETLRIAGDLARNAPESNRGIKELLRRSPGASLPEQLASERETFVGCAEGRNFAEGVRAFMAKRAPAFQATG